MRELWLWAFWLCAVAWAGFAIATLWQSLAVGTKSVLLGAHCFFLHPFVLARAWYLLHGWSEVNDDYVTTSLHDWRLWLAFFVHDLGYWGLPNMDGAEGEEHPYWGARVMERAAGFRWWDFVEYHSRFLAVRAGAKPSALCVADKLAIVLTPWWLYIPMTMVTGEIDEYMAIAARKEGSKYTDMKIGTTTRRQWYAGMQDYVARWVEAHKGGAEDTWTAKVYAH